MIKFKYHSFSSSLGEILRPMAEVILEFNGQKVEAFMCIDSGADITKDAVKPLALDMGI